jgi:reductive dehalogenase
MVFSNSLINILSGDRQLGFLPMHRLKHIEKLTNVITDEIQRVDFRNTAFQKAERGEYGLAVQTEMLRKKNTPKEPINASLQQVLSYLANNQSVKVADSKTLNTESPAVVSRHIKSLGYFLKADVMGICRLPKSAVYSHDAKGKPIDIDYQFAIVIVVNKDYQTLKASNGCDWISDAVSYQSYQRSALIAHSIANYIRKLGYPTQVEHGTGRYDVLIPPLLLWAGIGEVSRCGIVLNPFLGMSFKASAVLTNLPLFPDKPIDFGLQDFCRHCTICAEACPSRAISKGDQVMHNGYSTWKLNEQRCASFFILNQKGSGCVVCTKVCPWTRPNTWPHNLVRRAVMHSGLARRIATKIDANRRYPKGNIDEKWWFDLEEVDGALRVPIEKIEINGAP